MQFSSLGSSKMEIFETDSFCVLTIQNHQKSYLKHVLDPLCVCFTLFGCFFLRGGGGGGQGGWGATCLCSFPASAAQKWQLLKLIFFHSDHPQWSNILCKACFRPYSCAFHPFWVFGRGQGARAQPACAIFHSRQLKMEIFEIALFYVLTVHNDQTPYTKHVLDPLYVFFTLFGCWRGDGGLLNDFLTSYLID